MKDKIFYYVICFAVGILFTSYYPLSWGLIFVGFCISLIMVFVNKFFLWKKSSLYFLLLIIFLGAARQQIAIDEMIYNDINLTDNMELTGVISEEPLTRNGNLELFLDIKTGKSASGGKRSINSGKVLVKIKNKEAYKGSSLQLEYGDMVKIIGSIKKPTFPSNPGQFNYFSYCRRNGIQALAYPREVMKIPQNSPLTHYAFFKNIFIIKEYLKNILQKTLPEEDCDIVKGLIFGGTKSINPEMRSDLQKTGIIHVLSVSGFHVALLSAGVLGLTKLLRLSKKTTILTTGIILSVYCIMTGLRPSVIRAAFIAMLPLFGYLLGRRAHWLPSVSFAAFFLLLWNPAHLFMPGVQLSFAATWGILFLRKPISCWLSFLPKKIIDTTAVILAAQLATFPFLIYHFNYFSLVSVLSNLLLVPMITLVVLLVFISFLIGGFFLPGAHIINTATAAIMFMIKNIVWQLSNIPYAVINVSSPAPWVTVVYYGIILLLAMLYWRSHFMYRVIWIYKKNGKYFIIGILVLVLCFVWQGSIWPANEMMVTFLDVKEGDCSVIVTPNNQVIVFDTGRTAGDGGFYDSGISVLVPYLRNLGVQKVDLLVLSHFHNDHIGGIKGLINEFPIDNVLLPYKDSSEEVVELLALVGENCRVFTPEIVREFVFKPNIKFSILGPPISLAGTMLDENNNSLVVKLSYGSISYLFTGDIGKEAIKLLYANREYNNEQLNLHSTVFKVPHHGSGGSWDEEFYNLVKPKISVISVGPNYYGHPDKRVIESLKAKRGIVYRTDKCGAIMTSTDGTNYSISTFLEGVDFEL